MEPLDKNIAIRTCMDHHRRLREIIAAVSAAANGEESAIARLLARLRTLLSLHLELEDSLLYPALHGSDDAVLRRKARRYEMHMGGISEGFEIFFARWSPVGAITATPERFREDWDTLKTALLQRMDSEDNDLYALAQRRPDTPGMPA